MYDSNQFGSDDSLYAVHEDLSEVSILTQDESESDDD